MSINELLQKANFCSVNLREFRLTVRDNLKYYCCKKATKTLCNKQCAICENIYARYIIIDLDDKQTRQICNKYLFASFEAFEDFQKEHLAKIFFRENGAVRYNIYLIFIYGDNQITVNKEKFIQNTDYARKLFLSKSEFMEYFCFFDVIKELKEKNKFSNNKEIFEEISKIIEDLDKKHKKAILLPQKEDKPYISTLLDYYLSGEKQFDRSLGIKGNASDFIRVHLYRWPDKNKDFAKRIEEIKKIKIHKFRESCFPDNTELECARVNVLFGANAVGKSSVLDAIEYGFTGETHRYKNDDSLRNSKVEIITSDSGQWFNPNIQQTDRLKRQWYPYYMGTLNELFCRINFFDTDATYRFALEQGNTQETFAHIKKLLCNSKLLDMENCLIEYLKNTDVLIMLCEDSNEIESNNLKQKFLLKLFKKPINTSTLGIEEFSNREIVDFKEVCELTLQKIRYLINNQISSNIKIINSIFRRLFSYQYNVVWEDDTMQLKNLHDGQMVSINAMSTAQKVCLALSVIFAQFILAENSPKFILLDESVANFDSLHLLNLLDFLREFSNNGVQIFFTTANDDVAKIATNKFAFWKQNFKLYQISRNENGLSEIQLIPKR